MRTILSLLVFLGLALAQTPAGTLIRNQASAVVGGETYLSNVVETTVQAICQPAIGPNGTLGAPGQNAVVSAGGFAYFAYVLRNSGNIRSTFDLSFLLQQNDWNPQWVKIYQDSNENSQRDLGEPEINQATLEPAQQIRLILEVSTPAGATGSAYVSPVAACADGTRDADNFSRVALGLAPSLSISKTVSVSQAAEGQEVTYTVHVANHGNLAQDGPIYVGDALNTPQMAGLRYVPNSALAIKGILEYSANTATWQTSSQSLSEVQGLRLVLDRLEAGEEASYSFKMLVAPGATAGLRTNVASVLAGNFESQSSVDLGIIPRFALALGPLNLPTAQGQADAQTSRVAAGQNYCFTQTLLNSGNTADQYTLATSGLPAGVGVTFMLDQSLVVQPIVLQAGQQLDFKVCLSNLPQDKAAFSFTVIATSVTTNSSDPTLDTVTMVFDPSDLVLRKSADVSTASAGERVIYTLEVENPLPISLANVTIDDVLNAKLEFVSASDDGNYDAATRTVRWKIAAIGAKQTLRLTLTSKVAADATEGTIPNQFVMYSDEFPAGVGSQTVQVSVLPSSLLLAKEVNPKQAVYGDILTYKISIKNTGKVPLDVRLVDTPVAGLEYVLGTAQKGSQALEPTVSGNVLTWDNLHLAPEELVSITYKMRVLVGAPETLENIARATGRSGNGAAVAAAVAAAALKVQKGVFEPADVLVGRVFLDTNRDGKYQAGLDVPLPGARLVLSNGLQVLTDTEGRYAFRNLKGGTWEVYLDPTSAPFKPLPHPEHLGDGYRHRTRIEGLTVSDFPLERPLGNAGIVRETTLEFGPLFVGKKIIPLPNGVRVVLELRANEALPEFVLSDPLPSGGIKEFKFDSLQGQKTLTYDLPALRLGSALTDPQVRWRYP